MIYIAMFLADNLTIDYKTAQIICCLVPPLALQIGSGSFLKSYDGIPTSAICGLMVSLLALISVNTSFVRLVLYNPFYCCAPPGCGHLHLLGAGVVLRAGVAYQGGRAAALVLPLPAQLLVPWAQRRHAGLPDPGHQGGCC